jgi:hypothetical protein
MRNKQQTIVRAALVVLLCSDQEGVVTTTMGFTPHPLVVAHRHHHHHHHVKNKLPELVQVLAPCRMTKTEKNDEYDEDDWFGNLRDWFDYSKTNTKTKTKKTSSDDAWISKEFNVIGEERKTTRDWGVDDKERTGRDLSQHPQDVDSRGMKAAGSSSHQRAYDVKNKEEEKKKTSGGPWISKQFNDIAERETMAEGRNDWVARDMASAGKAENETRDWWADAMERTGKDGYEHDVDRDMVAAGSFSSHAYVKKKNEDKRKSKNELIQEDMFRAGKATGDNWIARDMQNAGKVNETEEPGSWLKNLGYALDKHREKNYDDVFKSMEEAGKEGARSTDWVAGDMQRAGKAESLTDKIDSVGRDFSYKFGKDQTKRYDVDAIREDMEKAGKAESLEWVAHDLEETGRSHDELFSRNPAPDKEMDHNETRIADDMNRLGKNSGNWIARAMERTGRADPHLNTETTRMSHKNREKDDVMNTIKVLKVEGLEQQQQQQEGDTAVAKREGILFSAARSLKKAVRTLKDQEDHPEEIVKPLEKETGAAGTDKRVFKKKKIVKLVAKETGALGTTKRVFKKAFMPWKNWKDL